MRWSNEAMSVLRPFLVLTFALALFGCKDDELDAGDEGSPDNAGEVCEVADDCYPDVEGELSGEAQCLDRVESGYCTHLCETDDDCCAVEGECESDLKQVCAPFESTGLKMCFLSCEGEDVGEQDENEYCQEHAHERFICRSTGGGSENRKVCVPEG